MKWNSKNFWQLVTLCMAAMMMCFAVTALADGNTVFWSDDWEDGPGLWYASNGVWEVGVPVGATEAHQGSKCAALNLDGNYPDNTSTRLISPSIALPESPQDGAIYLRFWQWFSFATDGDRGFIQVSVDGGAWETVSNNFTGYAARWSPFIQDLSAYAGHDIRVGFYFAETSTAESWGWYLDEVEIYQGNFAYNLLENFEEANNGTINYGGWYAENGIWEIGRPTTGPGSANGGNYCAGTVLNGNYPDNTNSRFVSPLISLPAEPQDGELWLSFMHFFNMATDGDYGRVDIWTETGWEVLAGHFNGYGGVWDEYIVDIASYAGLDVRFGFYQIETSTAESHGWYIDDVAVVEGPKVFNNPSTFEGGTRGWYSTNGIWEVGIPSSGPGVAHSGEMCWGTRLRSNYPDNTSSTLITPKIFLPEEAGILKLNFWHWFSFATDGDYGEVWIYLEDGTSAAVSNRFYSSSSGWSQYIVDLEMYAGQEVSFGFYHKETSTAEAAGWFIDDVEILGMEQSNPQDIINVMYTQAQGTPAVSWSYMPFDAEFISVYHSSNPFFIPNLGNRVALLTNDEYSFADYDRDGWYHFYQVGLIDELGHENRPVASSDPLSDTGEDVFIPTATASLGGNAPNPFNPLTVISFSVHQTGHVRLEIFDIRGRLVQTLVDRELQTGEHNAKFSAGKQASGVYFCRLTAGGTVLTSKMTMVR